MPIPQVEHDMQNQDQLGQPKIVPGALIGERGEASGEVIDLRRSGGMIRIPSAQDPIFFIGESVSFTIDTKAGKGQARATVRSRTELDGFRRFGLSFEASTLGLELSGVLIRHFDQLRRHRVQPQKAVRVDLKVRGQDTRTTGRMRNVSTSGIAVVIDAEVERVLARIVDVDVEFRLPGSNQALVFCSAIRHRHQQEDIGGVCIGLSFDAGKSPAFAAQQRVIADYILSREADLTGAEMWSSPAVSRYSG